MNDKRVATIGPIFFRIITLLKSSARARSLRSYGKIGGPNCSRLYKPPEKYQINSDKLIF